MRLILALMTLPSMSSAFASPEIQIVCKNDDGTKFDVTRRIMTPPKDADIDQYFRDACDAICAETGATCVGPKGS